MTRLELRRRAAPRAWLCLVLALAGCSSSSGRPAGDDDRDPATRDGGKGDAGKRADAGKSTRKDGGTEPTSSTDPGGHPGDGPAPKELLQLDGCGDDNAAALSASAVEQLKAGGPPDDLGWLYPYDGTVMPRGLTAPLLMWQGGAASAVYVKIRAQYFAYDGCLKPTADGQLQLPQDVWEQAGLQTLGPRTPYDIELSVLDGKRVRGPIKEQLIIAQATLKGSLFYNSYNSGQGSLGGLGGQLGGLGGGIGGGGSILRIQAGGKAEFFARAGSCTGCHTVSSNGERMIARDFGGIDNGQVYKLTPDTADNPAPMRGTATAAFVGLSPDGSVFINTAVQNGVGPNVNGAAPQVGNIGASLIETDTGNVISGSGVPAGAMMPTFASDGSKLVFSDYAQGAGKGLSLMDYDPVARRASNARLLYTGAGLSGWPFLLPDNRAVIFADTDSRMYSGEGVGIIAGPLTRGPRSDLMIVDSETGKASVLARAMGYATPDDAASDETYLPFGAEELHQSYYPTVSPVAAGGYFWVFFDSVRHYGNQGLHRQLWATAVAIQSDQGEFQSPDGLYALDPSAPAFYVPGQELASANHRAFTALDPCRADSASCESGTDCCSGFCTDGMCGQPSGCAKTDERCELDSDCCDESNRCIAGYCGIIYL